MTDYKQLCAELIDALDSGIPSARIRSSPLADQARAALAEPEPEPPTDTELSPSAEAVLSPAAQAVLDAIEQDGKIIYGMPLLRPLIAAALRAAADQAIPMTKSPWSSALVPVLSAEESRKRILAIANELEAL